MSSQPSCMAWTDPDTEESMLPSIMIAISK
jgi:hypothetical protein